MPPTLETYDLGRSFDGRPAVEGLNLRLEAGAVFALLGPNGAGKTTTVRLLAGLVAPSRGRALVLGHDVARQGAQIRARVGLLTETPGLYDRLTAFENLLFFARLYGLDPPEAAVEVFLRRFGLWRDRDRLTSTFSKGMKQKLALARALIHEPELLFLDEPTAGLDPAAARQVRKLIEELRSSGRTLLLTTHNLDEAERLADQIGVLATRLVASGTPRELRRRLFAQRVVVEVASEEARLLATARALPFVTEATAAGPRLLLAVEDPGRDTPRLVTALVEAGARIRGVADERPPLEEIYLRLLDEEGADHHQGGEGREGSP